VSYLWALITAVVPSATLDAPVYVQISPSVLKRSGTLRHDPSDDGYEILFCIATPPKVTLKCVVKAEDMLVIVEAQATEQGT
jgi:hypothetical protein